MNKKLIFTILISLFVLSGCSQNSNEEAKEETLKYEKETECTLANYTPETNSDGIVSYSFSLTLFYDDLDDNTTYMENNSYITFNSWNNAKKYYDNHKEEYKDLNMELDEENIDTDNRSDITIYKKGTEKNSPRTIIEEQKNQGFTCNTY